jgi:hypothetical protein
MRLRWRDAEFLLAPEARLPGVFVAQASCLRDWICLPDACTTLSCRIPSRPA